MLSETAKLLVSRLTKNGENVGIMVMFDLKYEQDGRTYKVTKTIVNEIVDAGFARIIYECKQFVNLMGTIK